VSSSILMTILSVLDTDAFLPAYFHGTEYLLLVWTILDLDTSNLRLTYYAYQHQHLKILV
ncbi:MAG: hypothetical protein ACP5U0_08750, partial [Caldisphaera sp.]